MKYKDYSIFSFLYDFIEEAMTITFSRNNLDNVLIKSIAVSVWANSFFRKSNKDYKVGECSFVVLDKTTDYSEIILYDGITRVKFSITCKKLENNNLEVSISGQFGGLRKYKKTLIWNK